MRLLEEANYLVRRARIYRPAIAISSRPIAALGQSQEPTACSVQAGDGLVRLRLDARHVAGTRACSKPIAQARRPPPSTNH